MTRDPFGQADCESEMKVLKSDYSRIYFDETPFNAAAIDSETYLIIGRRGSGKTALAQYFAFQKTLPDPIHIDVDEPAVYQQVLADIAAHASEAREIAIPRLKRIWEYVVWCVVLEHTRSYSLTIDAAYDASSPRPSVSQMVNVIIERLLTAFRESEQQVAERRIEELLTGAQLEEAKREVLRIASRRPVIIAMDTLEKYDVSNVALMNAMAALIQCAADFNLHYRERGIHLKVFMSGEVFPHLKEEVLQNPLKCVKQPVYLLWRPKDLLRLICWRLYCHLESVQLLREESRGTIDWEDHREVMEKMWVPYFGRDVRNSRGLTERTFTYVLRHTQMRPRQLILICNAIARRAMRDKRFPRVKEDDIRIGVRESEMVLSTEIINSFSAMYPRVAMIVEALMKMPMTFQGNELDRRAHQSASDWPDGTYSPAGFRRLVAELGIVGRVRRHNVEARYADADFEYSMEDRLPITHRDECVIHPMFYARLNVQFNTSSRVMPFTSEREGIEADGHST